MVGVTSNLGQAAGQLGGLGLSLDLAAEAAIDSALEDIITRAQRVNPVRSGRMKADYFKQQVLPGTWELGNQMSYAEWVFGGTRFMRPNAALNQVLDEAEDELTAVLDLTVTRIVADWR